MMVFLLIIIKKKIIMMIMIMNFALIDSFCVNYYWLGIIAGCGIVVTHILFRRAELEMENVHGLAAAVNTIRIARNSRVLPRCNPAWR